MTLTFKSRVWVGDIAELKIWTYIYHQTKYEPNVSDGLENMSC